MSLKLPQDTRIIAAKDEKYLGSYRCSFCEKIFMRKDRLDRHLFTHTGKKDFNCSYDGCDRLYTNSSHLRRHIKTCHESRPQIHTVTCKHPGCLQGFTNISNMNRHYKTAHDNPLPYRCSDCDAKFHRKFQLRRHQKTAHDIGEFAYICKECGEGFFNTNNYSKHLASTHKIKERTCDNCDRVFSNWTQLVKHRRNCYSNATSQRFECDKCEKKFLRKQNVKQHLKLHMQQEVVHDCPFEDCSKFYNAKRNLAAHIRSKHEGKHFMCSICKCKLSTKQKLEFHMEAHSDPEKAQLLKKPQVAVLLGIQMHENVSEELLKSLPQSAYREQTASAESEFSDY